MTLLDYLKLRYQRGLSLQKLGPNEARVIFDFGIGALAVITSFLFVGALVPGELEGARAQLWLAALPFLLVAFNLLFGIYSRLRMASAGAKALALLAAVLCASGGAWLGGGHSAAVILWALLTAPPLLLARLMLNLQHSRIKNLAKVVNHGGPIVIIGGAGYIGTHTVDILLKKGDRVRVLDRLMYGDAPIREFLKHPNFEFVEGDASDISKLTYALRGASAVVHLAGLVGDPACAVDEDFTRHTNIVVTRMVREVAQSLGVYRFIFASSCSVYGVSEPGHEVSESDELHPVSLYAQTKIDSEVELLRNVPDDFFVTVLRFATVFGHSRRARFDLVANLFTAQAVADGKITVIGPDQWRPFIHVRDLARAIEVVLDAEPSVVQSQVFNVGDERNSATILQLAQTVAAVVGKYRDVEITVTNNPSDRRNYTVSFAKIRSLLGFRAATLLEPGIAELAEHLRTQHVEDYRSELYSNLEMTKKAVTTFRDGEESAHIYAPLKS